MAGLSAEKVAEAAFVASMRTSLVERRDWPEGASLKSLRVSRPGFYVRTLLFEGAIKLADGRSGFVTVLSNGEHTCIVDGSSLQVHYFNAVNAPDLSTPGRAAGYLRFFCTAIAGDEGVFAVVDRATDFHWKAKPPADEREAVERLMAPFLPTKTEDLWKETAYITYSGHLFRSDMTVSGSGKVAMLNDQIIGGPLPIWNETYIGCVRVCG